MRVSFLDAPRPLGNSRGQGTVEYILLLVIMIAVILGGVYQFNTAFRVWADAYFGNYLTCLLETGELPGAGGGGGRSAASQCAEEYRKFNMADGRRGTGSGGGGGRGPSRPGSGDGDGEARPGGGGRGGQGGRVNSAFSRGAGGSGGGSVGQPERDLRAEAAARARAQRRGAGSYTGSTEFSSPGRTGAAGSARQRQRRDLDRGFYVGQSRREENEGERKIVAKVESSSEVVKRKDRFRVQRKPATAQVEFNDEPMTFGDYFRFLLIAAIIIALVVVIGGQAARLSKELE